MITQIETYEKSDFTAAVAGGHLVRHNVYTLGEGDKVLVLLQELPGIGQETLALADRFVATGYRVVMPHLFGPIGKVSLVGNLVRVFCMTRELKIFRKGGSSPIVDWLAALCRSIKQQYGVKGVAVIGMCLTGNFAISLMADESVLAAYASQPALPVHDQKGLHLSPGDIEEIKTRLDALGPMHCGRFSEDKLCTSAKFESLEDAFNDNENQRIIFHSLPGKGHSLLTLDFVDEPDHLTRKLLDTVVCYFDEQLTP
ncbi:dienelactone hydrolase [Neolewinella aurantiaca]|uniref:Dienelactone hydrolase n=1 Tax=Neolewinella aurantiaca TaxID=2602767 RepID=A0A5C7FWW2_9BACT|nr:dienelactone hydrolase family protein [Neolewinella aurantiaca]TXF91194.1 dienelactone hydrolase [Neolewinella aurantiaca]